MLILYYTHHIHRNFHYGTCQALQIWYYQQTEHCESGNDHKTTLIGCDRPLSVYYKPCPLPSLEAFAKLIGVVVSALLFIIDKKVLLTTA